MHSAAGRVQVLQDDVTDDVTLTVLSCMAHPASRAL